MSENTGVEIYSIGFTKKGAEEFFGLLDDAGIERLVDVRIRNRSQLAGFAKRDDLKFFLEAVLGIEYEHETALAPTTDLLDAWRDDDISWETYEDRFFELLEEREVESVLDRESFEQKTVLLCSEHTPEQCHRRLVIEYLEEQWGGIDAVHLGP